MPRKNNQNKKYEVLNHISDTGDSIYGLPLDQMAGGQIYVSEDKIRDIVRDELEKHFGKNNGAEL